jgi:hypothetical protein
MVYEVQVGPTGQIYQTVRVTSSSPAASSVNKFPTPLQAMSEIIDAEKKS